MSPKGSDRWVTRALAGLILVNGLAALFRPLAERFPERFEGFILLANYEALTRSLDIFLGVCLVYLSYQLLQRRLLAWWLSLVISVGLLMLHFASSLLLITVLLPLVTTIGLLATKSYFQARSEGNDIRQGALILAGSVILIVLYGTVGFWFMHQRDFGINFGWAQSLDYTLRNYLLLGTNLVPHSRHARWFLDSLSVIGGISLAFGLYSLFRPLEYSLISLPRQRIQVEELLRRHSHSSEDFFKLWPHDKSYFFSHDHQAALAYGVSSGVAVVVEDPVGPDASIKTILAEFNHYCLVHGWLPAYVYVSQRHLKDLKSNGLTILKIGEDAVVDVAQFRESTVRNKHFRNIANRFHKLGYTTSLHQPPHSLELMAEITDISQQWLAQPGRKEWQFFMGSFGPAYMNMSRLFVVRDSAGVAQAFANLIPSFDSSTATIDLMRYRPDAPPNLMDWLFLSLIASLEVPYFNLGLAPLSGLGETSSRPEEKLLDLIYRSRQSFISFQGLRQFKSKFEPDWQSKYVAYAGSSARIPYIAYAVQKIMS